MSLPRCLRGFGLLGLAALAGPGCRHQALVTRSQLQGLRATATRTGDRWDVALELPALGAGDAWSLRFEGESPAWSLRPAGAKVLALWSVDPGRFASHRPFRLALESKALQVTVVLDLPSPGQGGLLAPVLQLLATVIHR